MLRSCKSQHKPISWVLSADCMQHHNSTVFLKKNKSAVYCLTVLSPLLFAPFKVFLFRAVLKRGPRIATHLGTSSHIISHAFCLCSCAAHACWDNKLGASLRSWKRHFTTSGGMPSFLPVLPAPVLITCKPTVRSSCRLIKSIYLFLLSWYSSWTSGLQKKKKICAQSVAPLIPHLQTVMQLGFTR